MPSVVDAHLALAGAEELQADLASRREFFAGLLEAPQLELPDRTLELHDGFTPVMGQSGKGATFLRRRKYAQAWYGDGQLNLVILTPAETRIWDRGAINYGQPVTWAQIFEWVGEKGPAAVENLVDLGLLTGEGRTLKLGEILDAAPQPHVL